MFASRVTDDVSLPSDPSVIVTLRRLSWTQKQAAQKAAQQESAKSFVALGGAAFMKELDAMREKDPQAIEKAQADPYLTHDPLLVLVGGVKAWTAPEPVTKETLADLEPDDAEFLVRAVLALSAPKSAEEREGNGSVSTAT